LPWNSWRCLALEPVVILGGKRVDLGRAFISGDRTCDILIAPGVILHGIKRADAPHLDEQRRVARLLNLPNDLLHARDVLLDRIEKRTHRLLRQGVAECPAGGAAVPEHAADPCPFLVFVVEHGA
jgi:hypothetical protein